MKYYYETKKIEIRIVIATKIIVEIKMYYVFKNGKRHAIYYAHSR